MIYAHRIHQPDRANRRLVRIISGVDVPAETSQDGPEIAFDYDSGQVAIITGGYLFTVKITDNLFLR